MSQPRRDPFLPENKQPLMVCRTCGHYHSRETEEGYADWVRGRCRHTGLSTVPPLHTCEAWVKRVKKRGGGE